MWQSLNVTNVRCQKAFLFTCNRKREAYAVTVEASVADHHGVVAPVNFLANSTAATTTHARLA